MLGCKSASSVSVCRVAVAGRSEETSKRIKREPPAPARDASSGTPAVGNTATPCAACKLLRRRCAPECPFSPYFSPLEPHKFAAVHKVFGASNVSKMLMEVPETYRLDATNSLVYEANVRLRDPVYGCMGVISTLQKQVQVLETELSMVRAHLLKFKCKRTSSVNVLPTSHVGMFDHFRGAFSMAMTPLPTPPTLFNKAAAAAAPTLSAHNSKSSSSTLGSSSDYNNSSITNESNVSYFGRI